MLPFTTPDATVAHDHCPLCEHAGRFHRVDGCVVVRCRCALRLDQIPAYGLPRPALPARLGR